MSRSTDAGPRRSPTGAARVRDADRTRAAILDAALVEFGEHGYAQSPAVRGSTPS